MADDDLRALERRVAASPDDKAARWAYLAGLERAGERRKAYLELCKLARAGEVAAPSLKIAHLSDTWRDRWAHAAIGSAEVDFSEFVGALDKSGFQGPCVYELVDGKDPGPRIAGDLARMKELGLEA